MMTDPIADMLTRIRNGNSIDMKKVEMPYSKIKAGIAKKLQQEGFVKEYKRIEAPVQDKMEVYLKYGPDGEKIIRTIKRVSKPGRKVYKGVAELKQVLDGLGVSIVSTSKGILTDRECREQKVGGEVLCTVW